MPLSLSAFSDGFGSSLAFLTRDSCNVFRAHSAKQISEMLIFMRSERIRVVERIHEAKVGKFGVLACDGRVGRFDIQAT
jgi:hypothetical protein